MPETQVRPAEKERIILEVVVKPYEPRERPKLPDDWEQMMANERKVIRKEFQRDWYNRHNFDFEIYK